MLKTQTKNKKSTLSGFSQSDKKENQVSDLQIPAPWQESCETEDLSETGRLNAFMAESQIKARNIGLGKYDKLNQPWKLTQLNQQRQDANVQSVLTSVIDFNNANTFNLLGGVFRYLADICREEQISDDEIDQGFTRKKYIFSLQHIRKMTGIFQTFCSNFNEKISNFNIKNISNDYYVGDNYVSLVNHFHQIEISRFITGRDQVQVQKQLIRELTFWFKCVDGGKISDQEKLILLLQCNSDQIISALFEDQAYVRQHQEVLKKLAWQYFHLLFNIFSPKRNKEDELREHQVAIDLCKFFLANLQRHKEIFEYLVRSGNIKEEFKDVILKLPVCRRWPMLQGIFEENQNVFRVFFDVSRIDFALFSKSGENKACLKLLKAQHVVDGRWLREIPQQYLEAMDSETPQDFFQQMKKSDLKDEPKRRLLIYYFSTCFAALKIHCLVNDEIDFGEYIEYLAELYKETGKTNDKLFAEMLTLFFNGMLEFLDRLFKFSTLNLSHFVGKCLFHLLTKQFLLKEHYRTDVVRSLDLIRKGYYGGWDQRIISHKDSVKNYIEHIDDKLKKRQAYLEIFTFNSSGERYPLGEYFYMGKNFGSSPELHKGTLNATLCDFVKFIKTGLSNTDLKPSEKIQYQILAFLFLELNDKEKKKLSEELFKVIETVETSLGLVKLSFAQSTKDKCSFLILLAKENTYESLRVLGVLLRKLTDYTRGANNNNNNQSGQPLTETVRLVALGLVTKDKKGYDLKYYIERSSNSGCALEPYQKLLNEVNKQLSSPVEEKNISDGKRLSDFGVLSKKYDKNNKDNHNKMEVTEDFNLTGP